MSHLPLKWRKSSKCDTGTCVEMAVTVEGSVAVRDSKDPDGPVLRFTQSEWRGFMGVIRGNGYDRS